MNREDLLFAGVHKVNISLHSFENHEADDFVRNVCDFAEFAKNAASQGTIVVFRLWNKGFDDDKNENALHGIGRVV